MKSALPSPSTSAKAIHPRKQLLEALLFRITSLGLKRRPSDESDGDCVLVRRRWPFASRLQFHQAKKVPPHAIERPPCPVLVGPKAVAVEPPSDSDCVIIDNNGVGLAVSSDMGKKNPPPGAIVRPLWFRSWGYWAKTPPTRAIVPKLWWLAEAGPEKTSSEGPTRPKSEPDMSFEAPQLQVIRICF